MMCWVRQNSGRNELQHSGALRGRSASLEGQSFSPLIPKRRKKCSGLVTAHISRSEFVVPLCDGDSGNIRIGLVGISLKPSTATRKKGRFTNQDVFCADTERRLRHHLNVSHHCVHTAFHTASLPLLAIFNLPKTKQNNTNPKIIQQRRVIILGVKWPGFKSNLVMNHQKYLL